MTEVYWAPMGRCERCGQFMKRGLMNLGNHLEVCKGKLPQHGVPAPRIWYMPPGAKAMLDKAAEEYFENR